MQAVNWFPTEPSNLTAAQGECLRELMDAWTMIEYMGTDYFHPRDLAALLRPEEPAKQSRAE